LSSGKKTSLKQLTLKYLHQNIQAKQHDSIEDAKSAMALCKLKVEILIPLNEGSKDNLILIRKFNIVKQLIKSVN